MGFDPTLLWKAPEINPINKKARSIPVFNPVNVYGRVFHFSWFGFFIAFWSWYAFPPLLNKVIAADLGFSKSVILNSNIIGLTATLLVRLVTGPACDRFGARNTFAACLIAGAIPSFCAGGINNPAGLYAVRFFVGILGGSFVPCQVWTTAFFDKPVVGTANSLTAGWGNAGGGITYFVMPAVFTALVADGLTMNVAWRVSFIVPSVLIVSTAIGMLVLCPETPTGKWSERFDRVQESLKQHNMVGVVDIPGQLSTEKGDVETPSASSDPEKKDILPPSEGGHFAEHEAQLSGTEMMDTAKGEIVRKPTWKEAQKVIFSLQTLTTAGCYFCSFGTELAVNSVLGLWYTQNFPYLGIQQIGNWAAMFGLLNFGFRPLGGFVADTVYRATGTVWAKKITMHAYGVITGGFLIAIGVLDPKSQSTMFGLIAGMAFFLEGGNGLNFSLVPHVHPFANGIVSGVTGACGNFGGIIFSIIFRYGMSYGQAVWIIGIINIGMNLLTAWIKPIPPRQIGGR